MGGAETKGVTRWPKKVSFNTFQPPNVSGSSDDFWIEFSIAIELQLMELLEVDSDGLSNKKKGLFLSNLLAEKESVLINLT